MVGVDEGMAVGMRGGGGLDEADVLHADAAEFGGDELGGAAGVGGVLGIGGDGGDAQESLQLFNETHLVVLCKCYCCFRHLHCTTLSSCLISN